MRSPRHQSEERSRNGASRLLPMTSGVVIISLFYLFVFAVTFVLSCWIAFELWAGFLGGRLEWARAIRRSLREHFALMRTLVTGLRLRRGLASGVELTPDDAPELFLMLESLCQQQGIDFPPRVFLEMEAGALVRLGGIRREPGAVTLGLGLDLLAGTTRAELEAVLAHELTHARLTQRAVRNFLTRGLERAAQISRGLSKLTTGRGQRSGLPGMILPVTDALAEAAAQRIATFSRQEEFLADRGAADAVGAEMLRAALLKVEPLARFASRLSWRDRLAQLQAHTYTAWLVQELARVKPLSLAELDASKPDRFATHPTLRERLQALGVLGPAVVEAGEDRLALEMLADADGMAEKLMARILTTTLAEEEWDARKLRRWAREMRSATEMQPVQVLGAWLVLASVLAGISARFMGAEFQVVAPIFGASVIGMLLFWLGKYRADFQLPVPDFGLLKETWHSVREVSDKEIVDLETFLRARVGAAAGRKAEEILTAKGFEGLAEGDYVKAAVAARLLLARNPQSLPGLLTGAVASAWLGEGEATARALATVQKTAGLKGPAICWGMAWAFMLRGNWARAEALLEQVIDKNPAHPTLLNLRALCQLRRGKIQSAIRHARRACAPQPVNREHAKFLIDLLLEGGYLREAQTLLRAWDAEIPHDPDLILSTVRLNLAWRDRAAADTWAQVLVESAPPAHVLVQLGALYELARQPDQAARFYNTVLAESFYPDACLGLARVETERGHAALARRHAMDALNFHYPLGKYATPPLELLRPILTQLALLEPPVPSARAWIADVAPDALPGALAGMSFVVFAPSEAQAEKYLLSIIAAMAAGGPPPVTPKVAWRLAPPQHQPYGALRPGVQPLFDDAQSSPFRGFQRRGLWLPRHQRLQSLVDGLRLLPDCAVAA